MDTCINCGAAIYTNYCPHCGQERNVKRFEVKTIFHDVTHGIFHWESSILKTLKSLFIKPGFFIKDYLEGKRKSFVKPFSFFLFFQSVYVLIFHWMASKYFAYMNFTVTSSSQSVKIEEIQHLISKNVNYLNFGLPLFFALVLMLFLKKRTGINYAEALVFSFYSFAALLIFGMVFMLLSMIDIRLWNVRFVFTYFYLLFAVIQFSGYSKIMGIFKGTLIILISYALFILLISFLTLGYIKFFMQ